MPSFFRGRFGDLGEKAGIKMGHIQEEEKIFTISIKPCMNRK